MLLVLFAPCEISETKAELLVEDFPETPDTRDPLTITLTSETNVRYSVRGNESLLQVVGTELGTK